MSEEKLTAQRLLYGERIKREVPIKPLKDKQLPVLQGFDEFCENAAFYETEISPIVGGLEIEYYRNANPEVVCFNLKNGREILTVINPVRQITPVKEEWIMDIEYCRVDECLYWLKETTFEKLRMKSPDSELFFILHKLFSFENL